MKVIAYIFMVVGFISLGINIYHTDFTDLLADENLGFLVGLVSSICLVLLAAFMLVIQKYKSNKD